MKKSLKSKKVEATKKSVKSLSDGEKTYKLSLFLLLLLTIIVYSNSLTNGFVYDDDVTTKNNILIKDPSNIRFLFSHDYFKLSGEESYRPFVTLTYMIDYFFWGLNPAGYHFTNLLLHLISISSLYLLILTLWEEKIFALMVSAIFALNPVNTEAINAISFREDLLITPFCLFFLLIHRNSQNPNIFMANRKLFKYTAPVVYFLALISKEMSITIPFLAMAIDYYKDKTIKLKSYTTYLIVAILYLYVYFFLFVNSNRTLPEADFISRVIAIPSVISFYMRLFFFPVNLVADYAGKIYLSPLNWTLLIFALSLFFTSSNDKIKISIAWFFVSLIPVLNIVPLKHPIGERYLYYPTIGLSILLASLIINNYSKVFLKPILICLLIIFPFLTYERNKVWRDNFSLWTDTLKKMPQSYRAYNNLGILYMETGKLGKAMDFYKIALELNPNLAEAHNNLGLIYRLQGRLAEAEKEFEAALKLKPDFMEAYGNLISAYADEGRLEDALQVYHDALKHNPYDPYLPYNMGLAFNRQGEVDKAIQLFVHALELNPQFAEAHNDLGNALFLKMQFEEAIKEYKAALEIKPDYAEAHNNLGSAFFSQGLLEAAIIEYRKAIRIKKDFLDAHFNLGLAYWRNSNKEEALREFKYVLTLNPNHEEARSAVQVLSK
ncbi:MAG: tetratricopeptide repeat protein [Deltaproteobacteria bacterium]|nr:tetratricopeptide repeat protein [Deltaproteobacteria bacterium]